MNPLEQLMALLQSSQPKPAPVRPLEQILAGAQISPQRSQYERTMIPGEQRSAQDLQSMLGEVILAAGAGASPVTGPRGVELARTVARVRPGGEAAFNKWFEGSIARDPAGKPLDLFHGTASDFKAFKPQAGPNTSAIGDWPGIYLTPDRSSASGIAQFESRLRGGNAAVMPVYARVKNPAEFGQYKTAAEAIRNGHDGRVVRDSLGNITEVLVFTPQQIKSAIGNKGTYSASQEDIRE